QVVEDLVLRRADPRPVPALVERERVEVARDVAGDPGIGVEVPGASEVRRAVEDRDVLEAVPAQLDRGRDPPEPCADDDHPAPWRRTVAFAAPAQGVISAAVVAI